jgi:hypothetical protein
VNGEFPEIVWKTPPLRMQTQKHVWEDHLRPLMVRPGRWALVDTRSGSGASNAVRRLRDGHWKIPEGRWWRGKYRQAKPRDLNGAEHLGRCGTRHPTPSMPPTKPRPPPRATDERLQLWLRHRFSGRARLLVHVRHDPPSYEKRTRKGIYTAYLQPHGWW